MFGDHETNLEKTNESLLLYQQLMSMLVEVDSLVLFGGCLANNGFNILTNEKIISTETIHAINPIIMTCGMQHRVGHFIEETGLPSISSKSGAIMSILPGIGALVCYSPKLD